MFTVVEADRIRQQIRADRKAGLPDVFQRFRFQTGIDNVGPVIGPTVAWVVDNDVVLSKKDYEELLWWIEINEPWMLDEEDDQFNPAFYEDYLKLKQMSYKED